jgi:hypothetical protein
MVPSLAFFCLITASVLASAQDLAPRAYIITPMHSNAVTLTYSFFDGDLIFDNSMPVTGATARISVPIFSYFRSLSFFGRTASLTGCINL